MTEKTESPKLGGRRRGVYGRSTRSCSVCGSLKITARGLCRKHYDAETYTRTPTLPVLDLDRIREYRKEQASKLARRARAIVNREDARWKWAVQNPLHLDPKKIFRHGTDPLAVRHLISGPCPKCGAPPIFSECAVCMPLSERVESRSVAATWPVDPQPRPPVEPTRVRPVAMGTRRRNGVNEVCMSGIWTVSV